MQHLRHEAVLSEETRAACWRSHLCRSNILQAAQHSHEVMFKHPYIPCSHALPYECGICSSCLVDEAKQSDQNGDDASSAVYRPHALGVESSIPGGLPPYAAGSQTCGVGNSSKTDSIAVKAPAADASPIVWLPANAW